MKVEITGIDINLKRLSPTMANIMSGEVNELSGKIYCNVSGRNSLVEYLGAQQVNIETVPANFKKRIQDLLRDLEEELNK